MKIYIDSENKCHTTNIDGVCQEIETDFFNGKCDAFINGYYCIIQENGYSIYPHKACSKLNAIQREYERAKLAQLENKENELNASYQEGINSI